MLSEANGLWIPYAPRSPVIDAAVDLLLDLALLQTRHLDVGEGLRRHAADAEWIPGHAVRIGAVDHGAAHGSADVGRVTVVDTLIDRIQ